MVNGDTVPDVLRQVADFFGAIAATRCGGEYR